MGKRMKLWAVRGEELEPLDRGEVPSEAELHKWMENDLSLLSDDLILIGSEVEGIDILAMDRRNGDLVVIELKKGRTPREVVAQALDYASIVKSWDYNKIDEIISGKFGSFDEFAEVLKEEFEPDFDPTQDTVNSEHRIIIVGSDLDDTTERVINYLSEYGVPMNAALFEYFINEDGNPFLARTMVIEEELALSRAQTKRAPNLTEEEVNELAEGLGIKELYSNAVSLIDGLKFISSKRTTRSSVAFKIKKKGVGRLTLFSIQLKGEELPIRIITVWVIRENLVDKLGVDVKELPIEFKEDLYYLGFTLGNIEDIDKLFRFLADKVHKWLSQP